MKRRVEKHSERLGRAPKKSTERKQRSFENTATELTQQKQAAELKLNGATYPQIAEALGVDDRTARRLIARALDEYFEDRNAVVQRIVGTNLARYDQLFRTWWPRAVGGKKIDPKTGKEIEIEPNQEAARIALRAMRDLNMLIGHGETLRIEHTGANGGPIVTAQVDAMEAARLVRANFGGKVTPPVLAQVNPVPNVGGDEPTH
jgi:hypothetical protein